MVQNITLTNILAEIKFMWPVSVWYNLIQLQVAMLSFWENMQICYSNIEDEQNTIL